MPAYTVVKGETLWDIATKNLGSGQRWRELGYSGDPRTLQPGTTLKWGETPAPGTPGGADPAQAGIGNQDPNRPGAMKVPSPSSVTSQDEAKTFINANQQSDAASAASAEEPPTRNSVQSITDQVSEVTSALTGGEKRPERPSYESQYSSLRAEQGIGSLEDKLNELTSAEDALYADLRAKKESETGKPVAMGVIEGRIGELSKQAQSDIDFITRQKNSITNQLKTKYSIVDTLMKYKEQDYTTAAADYDRQFSQAVQTFNLVKGIQAEQKSDAETKTDNARANLQIIANNVASGALDEITPEQKLLINKLELESGLPQGFVEGLRSKNPKADIITTNNWTDASGREYVAVVMRDKDGKLTTTNQYVGQGKAPGSGTKPADWERRLQQKQKITPVIESLAGSDGHISPENWAQARREWVTNSGFSASDFDADFRQYIDPNHPADYEGFEDKRKNFK